MADISLRERLQPALLDRLHDPERVVHIVELNVTQERLAQLRVTISSLVDLMKAHGLRRIELDSDTRAPTGPSMRLSFSAPAGEVALARLKAALVPCARGPAIPLAECAGVEARTILNQALESAERRSISTRRLRESVLRDLNWLLNSANFASRHDLSRYPQIQSSVLNFGIDTLTGRAASSVDPQQAARQILEAIRAFEPRLTRVTVTPELSDERMDNRTLSFKIDAELWGRPMPQRLMLRTRLDADSGDLSVSDAQNG